MKSPNVRVIGTLTLSAAVLAACGGLGKMSKYAETITYKVDPEPLIVRGDSVELNINGNFPGKYFSKKASVDLTPVLVYGEQESAYKTVSFQGEDAAGNGTMIPYETGKDFTYTDKLAYDEAMEDSDVMLRIKGRQGSKEKDFEPYKLADGVITTPYLMMNDDQVIFAADEFERITSHQEYAQINYLVNSSVVRPTELRDEDMKALDAMLKKYAKDSTYVFKGATIESYASPEGELSLNENLAQERAESAQNTLDNLMRRYKVANYSKENFFTLQPKGEDWAGFKQAMQQSDIADKDLILRILEMYEDVTKREQEIKNLAATYEEVAEKILPELRRSQVTVSYEIVGKTDEQIAMMSKNATSTDSSGARIHELNVEELLYAATLTEDMDEKFSIYEKASQAYPNDYRAINNLGAIEMMRNNLNQAETYFQRANEVEENPVTTNNLGVIERLKGNRDAAMDRFNAASAAGNQVAYNKGIIQIQNGDYSSAIQNMSGFDTFNKALAQTLNGDAAGAASTLSKAPEKNTAMGHYLNAIIGARLNNADQVKTSLQSAYAMDASLREKAAGDLEFRNFQEQIK